MNGEEREDARNDAKLDRAWRRRRIIWTHHSDPQDAPEMDESINNDENEEGEDE